MAINSLSAASKGISGLSSGIDTQSVVESLLANTQGKITKTNQKKSVLQMKQQMYRDVATQLRTLQTNFLGLTGSSPLRSASFFNAKKTNVTYPGGSTTGPFTVSAGTGANMGNRIVNSITSLASAYKMKTTAPVSGGTSIAPSATEAQKLYDSFTANGKLTISVDGQTMEMADFVKDTEGMSISQVASYINGKVAAHNADPANAANQIDLNATASNNKLRLTTSNSSAYINVGGEKNAMKMLSSGSARGGEGKADLAIDTSLFQPSFSVTLDGRKQDIRVSLKDLAAYAGSGNTADLLDGTDGNGGLRAKLQRAFGSGVVINNDLTMTTPHGQTFTVGGDWNTLNMLGMKSGQSNKINTNMTLRDQNFATPLSGEKHIFSINGVEFSFSADRSLANIISEINASKAGVKISYSSGDDSFTIENAQTGAGNDNITFSQTEGNLLSAMFGVAGSGNVTTQAINKPMIASGTVSVDDIKYGGEFTFTVNGEAATFKINPLEAPDEYDLDSFTKKINEQLRTRYGSDSNGNANIELELTGNRYELISRNKAEVTVSSPTLGFQPGDTTRVNNGSLTLADVGISVGSGSQILLNGASPIALSNTDTLDSIAQKLKTAIGGSANVFFDASSQSFRFEGVDSPMTLSFAGDGTGLDKLFGSDNVTLNTAAQPSGYLFTTAGTDAVMMIDGVTVTRSSNDFTYEGLTFSLNGTMEPTLDSNNDVVTTSGAKITVERDTEKIVEAVTDFFKQYNELVDSINKLYRADPTYKEYAPLTEEQKASMSDSEIEKWEEKSKEGLLRSDQYLGKVMQAMRSALYSKPSGSSIAIYDIGMTTSSGLSGFSGGNEGNFVEKNAGDLRAFIESDPEALIGLFTGTDGIMSKLNNAIDEAAKASIGSPGYLSRVAGYSSYDTSSQIYKQTKDLDRQLTNLEKRYWKEYDRYWKQFNNMESLISKMNSQSSWLSQSLGG